MVSHLFLFMAALLLLVANQETVKNSGRGENYDPSASLPSLQKQRDENRSYLSDVLIPEKCFLMGGQANGGEE